MANKKRREVAKRALDLSVSLLSLMLLAIPLAIIGLFIRFDSKGPALFKQIRPGIGGKPFYMYKLRTMRASKSLGSDTIPDETRLTNLGRKLRRWSLDELPELWNVLKSEMSLVGPRPLLMEYLDLYSPAQARRHDTKPGITGWAQINGRNAISWEDKFEHDIWYIDNWSLRLDLNIIWITIANVIRQQDINQPGHATMEKFRGSGELNGR